MTKEEHIKNLKAIKKVGLCKKYLDSMNEAIKALEQQPCGDCVSRQSILEELNRLGRHAFKDDTDYDCLFDFVDRLPPVTPTRKSGLRWIERFDNEDKWLECPHCHKDSDNAYAYCPNCGASFKEEKRGNLDGSN